MEPAREIDRPAGHGRGLQVGVADLPGRGHGRRRRAPGDRPVLAPLHRTSRLGAEVTAPPVDEAALRGFDHSGPTGRQFMEARPRARRSPDLRARRRRPRPSSSATTSGSCQYLAGRPEVLRVTETVNLVPGGVWSERTAGTNGIGLALELGGSAHVFAGEHYLEALHGVQLHRRDRPPSGHPRSARGARDGHRHERPRLVRRAADRPRRARHRAAASRIRCSAASAS